MRWMSFAFALNFVLHATAGEPVRILFGGDPGPYTVKQWKHDWPGCEFENGVKQGHIVLLEDSQTRWLRVNFVPGQIGPEQNGAGWRWPFGRREAAELSYTVRFGSDFDWVKGGKLPGLSGGPDNVSGGRPANGTNGFSARLMWRRDGRGEAYVYHKNQEDDYGDSFSFPDEFRFPTLVPIHVRLRVTMNEPGRRNGSLQVWISLGEKPARLVVDRGDMEWRSVNSFGVDSIYFETFHGGSDLSWAPTRECAAEFSDFRVGTVTR